MATWRAFARTDAHGYALETDTGHAEITEGYTDHQLRVVVQLHDRPAHRHTCATVEEAKAWAERHVAG